MSYQIPGFSVYKSAKSDLANQQECSSSTSCDLRKLPVFDVTNISLSPITRSVLLYCRSLGVVMGQPLPMNGLVYGLIPTLTLNVVQSIDVSIEELTRLNIIDSRRALTRTGSDYLYKSFSQVGRNVLPPQCQLVEGSYSGLSFHVGTQQGATNHA